MSAQEGVIADYRDNPQMELPRLMYSYELKRVRYLLQCYHRTRLNKIEKFVLHVLEKDEVLGRLSEKEKTYAQVRHKTCSLLLCCILSHSRVIPHTIHLKRCMHFHMLADRGMLRTSLPAAKAYCPILHIPWSGLCTHSPCSC